MTVMKTKHCCSLLRDHQEREKAANPTDSLLTPVCSLQLNGVKTAGVTCKKKLCSNGLTSTSSSELALLRVAAEAAVRDGCDRGKNDRVFLHVAGR